MKLVLCLLAFLLVVDGCACKPATHDRDSAKSTPRDSAVESLPPGTVLLLLPEGRGLVIADSTPDGDCEALRKSMVGAEVASGDSRFRITGIGPSFVSDKPREAVPKQVLLYERISGPDIKPGVTIFPARSGVSAAEAIDWVSWKRDSAPTLKAAFRRAVLRKVGLKDVAFRQVVKANFADGSQPDLLIALDSVIDHGCNERDYDESKTEICDREEERDTWWLVLVPDGKPSRATVVWTGKDQAWAQIDGTYDLDGNGVHSFTWISSYSPNVEAIESSSEIRDGKIFMKCRW